MWKTNFSLQGTKLFFRPKTIFANNVLYIFSFILEFRNLKFPELETRNWKFPELGNFGTWKLRNLRTSELVLGYPSQFSTCSQWRWLEVGVNSENISLLCETQWRHSVKTKLYNTPPPLPHTSFCETQWRHSVKTRLYKIPSAILHCISQLGENKGGQGHWVSQN